MPTINIRWADNTAELKKNLAAGLDQIEATKAGVDKLASSLRGDNLVAAANKYAAAVQQIGGAANLTASNQERVNSIMTRAVESLNAAGQGGSAVAQHFKALADETDQAEGKTNLFVSALEGLGHSFVARVAEGVLLRDAVREFLSVLRDAVTDAAKFEDLSKAMGMSVEDVQRFNYVAPEFGLNVEEMARGVEQLSAKLANGDKNATSAVQMLGLNVKQLLAQSPKDAFLEVAEAVGKIEDPTTKIGVATELWGGKLAKTLLPALGELRQKLNDVPKAAIISDANVEKAHDFDVGLQHLTTTLKAYAATVLSVPGKVLDLAGQGEMGLEGFQPNGAVGPTPSTGGGADIALPGAQRTIDNATLIKNKLDALRTDALEPLSAAQKNQIAELKQWGEGEADIAKLVGASEAAVHRYAEAQKTAATAQKEFNKAEADIEALMQGTDWDYTITGALKVGASVHDVAVVFGTSEGAVEKNKQALRTWAEIAKIAADAHPLEGMLKDLPNVTVASDVLIQRTEQLVRAQALERVGLSEFSDGIEKVGRSFKETDNDIADAISEFGFIGPVFDKTAEQADKLGENLQHSVGETIANFPKLLQQGLTGGGGVSGAVSALGAELGADVGTSFSNKFKDAISRNLDAAFGQKVGDILAGAITGGIVPIVSSLIGSLINKIKNIGGPSKAEVAGRQGEAGAEQQYAALLTAQERVQAGTSAIAQGEAGLHKQLVSLGMDDAKAWDYARQQFDKMLAAEKQGPAAVQAIKDATDAYVESLQKVHDFESQFGPSHSELVQAAKDAEAGFAAMQQSGDYTADQLAKAFEKVKEAEAAAGDAAAQAWLDARKATTDGVASMQADLDKLQTQRDDLAKGVAAEAPEAVMGSIEKATRDQIAALDQQIADQKTKMEQAAKNTADSLQTATDAAGRLGGALDQAAQAGTGDVDGLALHITEKLTPSTEPFQAHLDGLGSTLSDTLPADAQTAASGINDALASIARDITVNVHYNVPPIPGAPSGEAPEAQPGAGGATGGLVADLVRGFQPRSFAAGGPVGYSMPILPPVNPSDTQLIWTNPNEWIFDRPRQAVVLSQLQAGASMAEFVRDTVQALTVQAPGTGSDTADEHTTIVQGVIDGQVLMEVQARRLARNKPGARAFKASLGVK